MTPKNLDELTLGATYLVVPAKGLVVRRAPRVSLAKEGEVLRLDVDMFRRAQHADVLVYDVPEEPVAAGSVEEAPVEETPSATLEAALEAPTPTVELESSAPKSNTRRARGDS